MKTHTGALSKTLIRITSCFIAALAVFAPVQPSYAHNKVVVVPMFDEVKPLANIITVSAKNGDFTDPLEAMASIGDASADKPYLIIIGPGVYTLGSPLTIKSFVSVAGSGRNSTILEAGYGAATRSDSGVIAAASLSRGNSLSALSINQFGFNAQISSGIVISRH